MYERSRDALKLVVGRYRAVSPCLVFVLSRRGVSNRSHTWTIAGHGSLGIFISNRNADSYQNPGKSTLGTFLFTSCQSAPYYREVSSSFMAANMLEEKPTRLEQYLSSTGIALWLKSNKNHDARTAPHTGPAAAAPNPVLQSVYPV